MRKSAIWMENSSFLEKLRDFQLFCYHKIYHKCYLDGEKKHPKNILRFYDILMSWGRFFQSLKNPLKFLRGGERLCKILNFAKLFHTGFFKFFSKVFFKGFFMGVFNYFLKLFFERIYRKKANINFFQI